MTTRSRRIFFVLVMTSFVAACAPHVTGDCAWAKPIILSDPTIDVLTRSELEQIAGHNEKVERLCR